MCNFRATTRYTIISVKTSSDIISVSDKALLRQWVTSTRRTKRTPTSASASLYPGNRIKIIVGTFCLISKPIPVRHEHLSRVMTKPTKWLCAQRRLRSAWASAQSDQRLRFAFNRWVRTQAFVMRTAKTDHQTGRI